MNRLQEFPSISQRCLGAILAAGLLIANTGCSQQASAKPAPPGEVSPDPRVVLKASSAKTSVSARPARLRREREVASLNLFYGPGGKDHQPAGPFTFVQEDNEGSAPKFEVVDARGSRWKVKLGDETKSETAATRLLWAAGYFTDEDYYLPEIRVDRMPKLHRGSRYVSKGGMVREVRLERHISGQKKVGNWSWSKNPFVGTKELSGLSVMMALMNNWDLKKVNNAIYQQPGEDPRYVISDLGATFGKTGNTLVRSKSNLRDYGKTRFLQKVKPEEVDFHLSSRPLFVAALDVPYYVTRTKMEGVVKHIPRSHAKWLGQQLSQLSPAQIRDCFRAAGYSPDEVEGFSKVVEGRIDDLKRL